MRRMFFVPNENLLTVNSYRVGRMVGFRLATTHPRLALSQK